nr:hypothetical protein [Tanacetum cinerariifolium]
SDDEDMGGEQEQDEEDNLYRDVNINLERSDAEMTNAQANQDTKDTHVTLTTMPLVVQQQSSFVSSDLVSKFINPSSDTTFSSILGIVDNYLASKMEEAVDVDSTMTTIIKEQVQAQVSKTMPNIKKYVTESLGAKVLVRSTNQPQTSYAVAASLLEFKLKKILVDKIEENQSRGRDDQDKDEDPSDGSNRGSKRRRSGKETESSKEPTHKESKSTCFSKGASKSQPKSSGKSAYAEEHGQKVDDLKEHSHQDFNTGDDDVIHVQETLEDTSTQSSFNEFLATPIDFSAFIMNRLKIDNLTQKVLTGLTYDLIKGTYKSLVELKYHLEEVFKATNDRLDWHNPEGKPYPHDLRKPLLLILNERGRQVIPWDYFINNNLEYLKGGSLS